MAWATFSWKASRTRSLSSWGLEMKADSTRTAGQATPVSTLNGACLMPRSFVPRSEFSSSWMISASRWLCVMAVRAVGVDADKELRAVGVSDGRPALEGDIYVSVPGQLDMEGQVFLDQRFELEADGQSDVFLKGRELALGPDLHPSVSRVDDDCPDLFDRLGAPPDGRGWGRGCGREPG